MKKENIKEKKPVLELKASINGKQVWSNIEGGISINNSILTFEDGSTCDVDAREICNCGKGIIEIRGSQDKTDEKEVVIGPKIYQSEALKISGVNADIKIMPHNKGITEITISGPESICKSISLSGENRTLSVKSGKRSHGANSQRSVNFSNISQVISGNFFGSVSQIISAGRDLNVGNISIDGDVNNCIIMTGSHEARRAKISIMVPRGIEIDIDGVDGMIDIGDTDGCLEIETSSYQKTTIGCVRDVMIESNGKGDVFIKKVIGKLETVINDHGSIHIEDGTINNPVITNNGYGSFIFEGKANNPKLKADSHGTILIEEASGIVSANAEEFGSITINKGSLQELNAKADEHGNITFNGTTQDADLESNEHGNIRVEKSINRPYKEKNDHGKITVVNW